MTPSKRRYNSSKRGISSIVGAMIFTVLMISGFSALSLAMETQSDLVKTHIDVADMELKKQQENFDIAVTTNGTNHLKVDVTNKGQNPVEISRMWIVNKTLATKPAAQFSINPDDAYVPTGFITNILSKQPLKITPDKYDVKIVSKLGSIKTQELTVGTTAGLLKAKLITDPPDVIIGQNVTIAMLVTNSATTTIENVTPLPGVPPPQVASLSLPNPSSATLGPGESALFSWDYILAGVEGAKVTFTGSASGNYLGCLTCTVSSNVASDVSTLRIDQTGVSTPGGNTINLYFDLLARPQLFLTIPGPHGDSSQQVLWGVNIVNPVNAPMVVSKVTITAFAPGANNNDKIFAANCGTKTNILPTGGDFWSCPSENLIMWENYATPVTIPPLSSAAFMVKVTPGTISGVNILEYVSVQAGVFTNVGSFGKAGYQTTMYDGTEVSGSIYLSTVVDSRNDADMRISRLGVTPGSTQNFKVVMADLDTVTSTYIKSGGKLVINVPAGWTNVNIVNNYGFETSPPPTVTTYGDGSTQIIAKLATNLGDVSNQADTIEFTAVAPVVLSDTMYVFYLLAEGETALNFAIGPLTEVVVQVDVP